ncbi:hypothetical protein [Mycolicibacterium aichiense]|uniref:Uncharacterized protein n=1 Tax=Mycolicibacterium aichiense TaxID=1799 RepID=A0AAD1HHH5_9MYCO|nr:hypothetical protein [Mycolicibacterium aichiense]MCV7020962.1 hypothetical protein [Mycolicibacterium aichiense]BBX05532.1 hypothetical protein MAIC_03350 [Mycolicibacterium aichiense]STZ25119.1 Uncharacterised protein [Mycolicibacterium aichiense]
MNNKTLTAMIGAAAIAMLALFAVTGGADAGAPTHTTADSGQESKFPTPTPPPPAEVSGAVTTTMVPAVR